jgi:hypothetical protein
LNFFVDIEKTLASAHSLAELGNRAKPNIHDITRSLENGGVEIATFKQYLQTNVNDTNTGRKNNEPMKRT